MDRITKLRGDVDYLTDELRSLHTAAGEERSFTDDEQTRWDEGNALRDQLTDELKGLEARAARAAELDKAGRLTKETGEDRGSGPAFHRDIDPYDVEYRRSAGDGEAAKRAVGEFEARGVPAAGIEKADRLRKLDPDHSPTGDKHMRGISRHLLVFGSDAYRRAFAKALVNDAISMTDEERAAWALAQEFRAASTIAGSAGYNIPTILDPSIIWTTDGALNPFRPISTVKQIMTNTWTGVTSGGITMSWDTEGSEVSEDSPTFTQPTIDAHRLTGFVEYSIEVGQDVMGWTPEIAAEFGQADDEAQAAAFATGSGSNQPTGIVTALVGSSGAWTTCGTNNALATDDLFKARRNTGPRYWPNASWVMNIGINDRIRGLSTNNNMFSDTVTLAAGQISQILGRPAYVSQSMDSVVNTDTNNIAVYGDFRNFYIVDRIGMTMEYIPHTFATGNNRPSGKRGLYTYHRVGADSVNDAAFTLLVNQSSSFT